MEIINVFSLQSSPLRADAPASLGYTTIHEIRNYIRDTFTNTTGARACGASAAFRSTQCSYPITKYTREYVVKTPLPVKCLLNIDYSSRVTHRKVTVEKERRKVAKSLHI